MDLIKRITGRQSGEHADTPSTINGNEARNSQPGGPTSNDTARSLARKGQASGLPPVKQPNLPPNRAAALIACTKSGRAYWHVFKRAPESALGWKWERYLTAVPTKPKASSTTSVALEVEVSTADKDLDIGGKDWGEWHCPGCSQTQIERGPDRLHLQHCPCGTNYCLGPGRGGEESPSCPNCGRKLDRRTKNISGRVSVARSSSKGRDKDPGLESGGHRQIPGS